jgi:hypothetical protein
MAKEGEIIIEFYRVGAYVKVSAIDPRADTEVSIVGLPEAGKAALTRAVLGKLDYVRRRSLPKPRQDRGTLA